MDPNGVMGLTEELVSTTISRALPHLNISVPPFQRMTYREAMEKVCVHIRYYVTMVTGGIMYTADIDHN